MQLHSQVIAATWPKFLPAAAPQPPVPPRPPRGQQLTPEQETFHDLVDVLRRLNEQNRKADKPINPDRLAEYAIHNATVQADIGRRCGKTSYIRDRTGADDLIIVSDAKLRAIEWRDAPCAVITAAELSFGYRNRSRPLHGHRYSTVYIDEPARVFEQIERYELYHQLARDERQTFILLGP